VSVAWSDRALRSLAKIHESLSAESADAANRAVDRILKRGDQLVSFPNSGRAVDRYERPGLRELIEPPYRIVYRVRGQQVQVVDVFHSSQLPPWER
jgi:toxin ParE1/3/4